MDAGRDDDPVLSLLDAGTAVLDPAGLTRLTRALRPAPAPIRYRRFAGELDRLAADGPGGSALADFLAGDAAVLARMTLAEDVLRSIGVEVELLGAGADLLRRAQRWRRYSRGPVPALHRRCAVDIARGSLRLWARSGGVARTLTGPSVRDVQARFGLAARVRTVCRDLRAELTEEAAGLPRGGIVAFEARVAHEVRRAAAEFDGMAGALLPAAPGRRSRVVLPPFRRPRLENRLAGLLGVGFGASVSLTVGRVAADLCPPGWTAAATAGCILGGLMLTFWVVRVRWLLTERAAAERWLAEVVASLRAGLEDGLAARVLATRSAPLQGPGSAVSDRCRPDVGHTPN